MCSTAVSEWDCRECSGCPWSIASLGRLIYWLPQLRSRTVITSDGPIRLREVPAPREWLLDRAALDDNKPQGVQLNLALGQTFANNQYVSGIETMSKK